MEFLKIKTNELIEKEIRFVVLEAMGDGRKYWRKVVKRYKLSVIRYISTRDVMYNMMTITNADI